mgnify:CR=1 FL=1
MQNKDHVKLSNFIVYGGWLAGGGIIVGLVGFFFGFLTRSPALMALMGLGGLAVVAGLGMVGYSVFTGIKTLTRPWRASPNGPTRSSKPDSQRT